VTKKEGMGLRKSRPSPLFFLKTPVFGAQNGKFSKTNVCLTLTDLKTALDSGRSAGNLNMSAKRRKNRALFCRRAIDNVPREYATCRGNVSKIRGLRFWRAGIF